MTNLEFHDILNSKMGNGTLQPRFIKPFSKGQITLPKDFREYLGIEEDSWLKVSLWNQQILVQPVRDSQFEVRKIKSRVDSKTYLKILLKIKGDWFEKKEIEKIREEIKNRLSKNEKASS